MNVFTIRTHRPRPFSLLTLAAVLLITAACSRPERKKNAVLTVVTTTGMIKDAVENIAGNNVNVIALMGPGVDPHLYKATQGDLQKLTGADVVFYNGLHLEGKMGTVLEKLARLKPVIAVASGIPEKSLRTVPGFQGAHDPHIWFDVKLWEYAVQAITRSLQEQDSVHADLYAANSRKYLARLDSLHNSIHQQLQEIPKSVRVLITAHDAFGYFGDAYQVEVRGLQGISTLSEFGLKDVTDLVNFIRERKIKAIFVETSVSHKSIDAVVEGCHQRGWPLTIGGNLFSDAMGAAETPEGNYIGMVNANVQTIIKALK